MNEVVKFYRKIPYSILPQLVVTGKQNAVRLCSALSRTESCGSAQIIRKMFIRIFRITPILKFVFLLRRMRGFA